MKKYSILFLALTVLIVPQFIFAQTRIEEQLSIEFTPLYPGPEDLVFVDIESYQTDLDKSEISWYINNSLQENGVGLKSFSFFNGKLGEETVLSIKIKKPNGSTLEKEYSFYPGEVDLYYEADTYTPPFYKGKSEFTYQSDLKLIAVPNFVDSSGNLVPSSQVVYKWKIDGDVDQKNSGAGRDTYNYQGGLISGPIQVVLEASPIGSDQKSRTIKTITPVEPEILVYENNPIYGLIFAKDIKDVFVSDRKEIELVAIPYGFSSNILSTGKFDWFLNGYSTNNNNSNGIVFRREDDKPSENKITVEIRNQDKIIQIKKYDFNLSFGQAAGNFNF